MPTVQVVLPETLPAVLAPLPRVTYNLGSR